MRYLFIIFSLVSFSYSEEKNPCIGEVLKNGKNIEKRYVNYRSCRHTYLDFIKPYKQQ